MKQKLHLWIEDYLFFPNNFQKIISFLLLPFTFIYMLIILIKRAMAKPIDFGIPIISVGNIIVGGSGKTPVTINLASKYENVCIILRGYGRASKGLQIVSLNGDIKVDVTVSGDEAMLLAKSLKKATIIVSENRIEAILKAKDTYGRFILVGIFALFATQIVGNIAVVTGMIPSTGIPLPIVSYGGSSIIMIMAALGIVYNIIKNIGVE